MRHLDSARRTMWIQRVCGPGVSFWFKGDPPFYSYTSHMFFVLGKVDKEHFLMVNATSQVSPRLHHLSQKVRRFELTAQDVSVKLSRGSHSFISKDTVIDCSEPFQLNADDLIHGEEFALFDDPPSPQFFAPLLKAWAASPFTSVAHLETVRLQWFKHGITF